MKKLLDSRPQVETLVNLFYERVKQDELIGPIFVEVAKVNWDHHLPKLYDFWEDLLLGTDHYRGRPFPPHMKLDLQPEHFRRWLEIFLTTVDENFTGLKAEEAKGRALRIARNFMINLNLLEI